jgi:hypothetical protein|tara:strand:+ start:136 stop:300 length:165 start_codon:yes stop_codon:yes gene_type:complete
MWFLLVLSITTQGELEYRTVDQFAILEDCHSVLLDEYIKDHEEAICLMSYHDVQ